jgi:DnaJ-class molecular chaperone
MRKVAAAAAVALAATATTSKASSTTPVSVSVVSDALRICGGASFPDNDKNTPPKSRNKKKKTKAPRKAEKQEQEKKKEPKETKEEEASAPPSPQETLIQELLQEDDYYAILGVGKTATSQQIQKAYRRRAVQTHPDKVPNNDRRAFDKVAEAYDILSDDTKRATYDRFGKRGLDSTAEGRPPSSFTEDIFRSFFGSQFSNYRNSQQPHNRTVRYQLEVTLEDLYNGIQKNVIVTEPSQKKVQVSIERGMLSGQAIVLSGEMDHVADATPADLVFVIQQRPHPHFTRKGHDLAMELSVSLQEAICGMTRTIRHLDGRLISISSAKHVLGEDNVNMLIQTGDVHVLKGEGMPKPGERDSYGDLYVQYKVVMPTQEAVNALTSDEREQLGTLLGKLEGNKNVNKRAESDKNVRFMEKASPADFGRASGPFRVDTEGYEEEHSRRTFPFGQRQFHFANGSNFFGGFGGFGGRPNFDDDDDETNVQCQQM